ncbi:hypothetical protein PC119_g7332 [Phytophthora cactorum]|nr:hypothetical protein PC119_g7332 [Phytophthora cactorum]
MKRNIEDIWLLSGDIIDRYKLTFTRRWSNIAVPFSKRFIVKRNEETGRSKVPQLCSAVSDYFPGARTHGFSFTEFLLSGPNNDSSPSSPDLETPGSTPAPDLIPASTPVSTPAPAPTTAPASASTTTPASILAENQHDENLCRVDGCNARVQIRGRCLDVTAKEPRVCSSTSDITAKLSASSSARRQELQARLYCEAALSARSAELFAILGGDAAENFDTAIDASSTRPTIQTTAREQQKVAEQFCNDVVSARADHFMRTNSASWSSALALAKPHANGRGRPVIATESRSATSGAAGTWPTEDRCARRTRLGQPANTQGADSN